MTAVELFDLELRVLLEAVYQRYHYDFRDYAVSSLRRRMRHAMGRFDCARVADLQHRLLHEPDTFAQAMQFFTVQVSEMFRDPAYFRVLREHAVPVLRTYPSIKLWVAGCSTGEEVWSLAILLHEEGLLERAVIYATDINPEALNMAEAGAYGIDRIAQFSRNYLDAGGAVRCRITTPPPTTARCSTAGSNAISCLPITAWPPTRCSPKCIWCRAATC